MGVALPSVKRALFGGGALPPSLRDWYLAHGVAGYQCYADADLGLIAYETEARDGLVLDEGVLLEIVRPGTGDPVPEGEVGEVVVTVNPAYPLVRFGTGADRLPSFQVPARLGQPTSESKVGLAERTRPPKCAACLYILAKWQRLRVVSPKCKRHAWWSAAKWPTMPWPCMWKEHHQRQKVWRHA